MSGDPTTAGAGGHPRGNGADVVKSGEASADRARRALSEVGRRHGGAFSWHRVEDPFGIFVAEYLLRRTTRKVVDRVFPRIIARYPTASDLAEADPDELWELASPAGLRKRTLALRTIAERIAEHGGMEAGDVDREFLLDLPFVGPYIADAVLLYAFDEITFPLDGNAKRVVYRMMSGEDPPRQLEAHSDHMLLDLSARLLAGIDDSGSVRDLHQGMLHVAWHTCRPRPLCSKCLVRRDCLYGSSATQ